MASSTKKNTETVEATVEAVEERETVNENVSVAAENAEAPRVYVYIGPSVQGFVQTGSIYYGTRKEVLEKLKNAIEKYPKIKQLVVLDTDIVSAKEKIKQGNNSLANAYKTLTA